MMAEAAADAKGLTATDTPPWHYGGYTAPFDLSALFLVLALGLISVFWGENYGEESPAARGNKGINIMEPLMLCLRDPGILMTGIVVSLFVAFAVVLLSSANWIMAALATVQLARAPAAVAPLRAPEAGPPTLHSKTDPSPRLSDWRQETWLELQTGTGATGTHSH